MNFYLKIRDNNNEVVVVKEDGNFNFVEGQVNPLSSVVCTIKKVLIREIKEWEDIATDRMYTRLF